MLSILRTSIPTRILAPHLSLTIPARTFLTTPERQEAAVPAKRAKRFSKANLKKLGIDESLLPPKPPASAYGYFVGDFYKTYTGEKSIAARNKALVEAWKALSDAERKVYAEKYAKEQTRYLVKHQEWRDSVHPSVIGKINRLKRDSGKRPENFVRSDGIKRPMSSYLLFHRDFTKKYVEDHGKISKEEMFSTFTKVVSESWRKLPKAEKDVYAKRYEANKAEYLAKLEKLELKTASST